MDFFLQGPLHRKWGQARPLMHGPHNGTNWVNHLFTRGGVDHWYRQEYAAGVHGPGKVWVHFKTTDMRVMRPGGKPTVEFLE